MSWCPKCKTEYLPNIKICADCKTPLADKLSEEKLEFESLESVFLAPNEIEALRIVNLLKQAGIKTKAVPKQIPMYDNLAQLQQSYWGEILVQKDKLDESIKIINEFLESLEEH